MGNRVDHAKWWASVHVKCDEISMYPFGEPWRFDIGHYTRNVHLFAHSCNSRQAAQHAVKRSRIAPCMTEKSRLWRNQFVSSGAHTTQNDAIFDINNDTTYFWQLFETTCSHEIRDAAPLQDRQIPFLLNKWLKNSEKTQKYKSPPHFEREGNFQTINFCHQTPQNAEKCILSLFHQILCFPAALNSQISVFSPVTP